VTECHTQCWCHIIVLNVHAPTEDKIDDMKDSLDEELQRVCDSFHKFHTKILSVYFGAEVGWEGISKPAIGNESIHEVNGNGVRVVNFTTSKNPAVKVQSFPILTFVNILGHLQMGKPTVRFIIF
jgi:hypothetical protein